MAQASRPCKGCGATIYRTDATGPIKHYCGPECRPRCSVEGCEKPQHGNVYCGAHHTRWKRTGDPLTPKVRHPNVGACSVDGCDKSMRKMTLCVNHYSMKLKFGKIQPWAFKWAQKDSDCMVCGKPNGVFRSRKFCSSRCLAYWHRNGGVPTNPLCARCGVEIDLTLIGKGGKRQRRDTKLCKRCKVQHRTEATPGQLARVFGPYCQLCGCDVDLLAVFPDKMRPSVDHVTPRAHGGSDALKNNQLTHLLCNQIKSDRMA